MMYKVQSERMAWPSGSILSADDLAGCNIVALVEGGHLAPVAQAAPDVPQKMSKRTPVEPVPDDTAEGPEEQE
jgi:hypothetical protein